MQNMQYIGGANLENVILWPFDVCILPISAVMKTLAATIKIESGALLAQIRKKLNIPKKTGLTVCVMMKASKEAPLLSRSAEILRTL